jgi:hypothetical protein
MMISFQPEEKYVNINGLRLHYLDWGNPERQPANKAGRKSNRKMALYQIWGFQE